MVIASRDADATIFSTIRRRNQFAESTRKQNNLQWCLRRVRCRGFNGVSTFNIQLDLLGLVYLRGYVAKESAPAVILIVRSCAFYFRPNKNQHYERSPGHDGNLHVAIQEYDVYKDYTCRFPFFYHSGSVFDKTILLENRTEIIIVKTK